MSQDPRIVVQEMPNRLSVRPDGRIDVSMGAGGGTITGLTVGTGDARYIQQIPPGSSPTLGKGLIFDGTNWLPKTSHEQVLASSSSVGATSITTQVPPAHPITNIGFMVIDIGTVNCEIRKVTGVSGATLTLSSALTYAHSANAMVYWFAGGYLPITWWGAIGDGTTVNTTAIQRALDTCYNIGKIAKVYVPGGTYKTGVLNWKYVTVEGDGSGFSSLLGLSGEDILHADPSISYLSGAGWTIKGLTFTVNDASDVSAAHPDRRGYLAEALGNAGIAIDWSDGADTTQRGMYRATMQDVTFQSTSFVAAGQNKSCGLYNQGIFAQCRFSAVECWRLVNGFWNDHPRTNMMSMTGFGADHNKWDHFYWNGCQHPCQFVSAIDNEFNTMTIHTVDGQYGFRMKLEPSTGRSVFGNAKFSNLMIEQSGRNMIDAWDVPADGLSVDTALFSIVPQLVLSATDARYRNVSVGDYAGVETPKIKLTGDYQDLEVLLTGSSSETYAHDLIDDQGIGNKVICKRFTGSIGAQTNFSQNILPDGRTLHQRDAASVLLGHTDNFPLMVGGSDLLVSPMALFTSDGTEITDFTYHIDTTTDFKRTFRWTKTGSGVGFATLNSNGNRGWYVGKFLPASKLTVYMRMKVATAGTMFWQLYAGAGATGVGSATFSLTTSYATYSFEADLTGFGNADQLWLSSGVLGGGGALPLDIAWVGFRPYFKDVRCQGAVGHGHVAAATPTGGVSGDVKIGNGKIWVNDAGTWKSVAIA